VQQMQAGRRVAHARRAAGYLHGRLQCLKVHINPLLPPTQI
jgi:hypothetical protein